MRELDALPATEYESNDLRARKRISIGLAPERPTAQAAWQRPPERVAQTLWSPQRADEPSGGWLVSLLAALALATVLLIAARLVASPTAWPQVQTDALAWLGQVRERVLSAQLNRESPGNLGTLLTSTCHCLVDDFTAEAGLLARHRENDRWWLDVLPAAGVYRMMAWPQHVAWSTLGLSTGISTEKATGDESRIKQYKVESSLQITAETPAGYAGLLARFQDERNYYLFALDGQGRFQLQLLANGILATLQPWTANSAINRAGQSNLVALADDDRTFQFFVNGVLIYTLPTLQLPAGDVGVFVGAPETSMAVVNFDWIGFYAK